MRVLDRIKKSGLPVLIKVERIDHLDNLGIPVYAAAHSDIFGNCGKPSWGKGITEDLAYVSALMERVERYSASDVSGAEDIVRRRFIDFKQGDAVSRWDLVPCNLQRKLYTKAEVDRQELLWAKCFSFTKNRNVFIPVNMVYFLPAEEYDDFSYTTGLASGNSIEEAILHALCEVIERHVEEVAYNNKVKFPTIDLATIKNKEVKNLINAFISNDFNLQFTRMDTDFNVSIIRAFAYEKKGPYANTYSQYTSIGVHPNENVAIIRALTEIAQARACNYYQIKNKTQSIEMVEVIPDDIMHYFSDIMDRECVISLDDVQSISRNDISSEIRNILKALKKKKCEVIFKDLTLPKLEIPVVRVIVRGLQPGNLGVGVIDLKHDVARISENLTAYQKLLNEIVGVKHLKCVIQSKD
ncbi:MAG: YcaO-like family protein [Candidatus Moranbacteria bacterium]|nr:YcaO-like family protein [Candidatus Moranbacteria bacterium]